ncbi:MAG: uroporphyrinogen-III C-methyltransferase [Stenotrophobium sp.]
MTENETVQTASPRPARRWLPLLILLLLALMAAGGWLLFNFLRQETAQVQNLTRDFNALELQSGRLDNRIADIAEAQRRNSTDVAAFGTRLDEQNAAVAKLSEQYQGGRVRVELTTAEQLLMSANDSLLLEHDAAAALTALALADDRLGALGEPRLFNVRRAIAEERAALQAVPQADLTAAALTFSSLISRVSRLPLRARVPDHFEARTQQVNVPADAGWAQRGWASIKQALSSIFVIRRNNGPAPRLLPPDEEALVYQILAMKLEGARIAMLRRDSTSYRDLCDSASAWLRDYFRADDPGVLAAQAELERLRPLQLNPPLPDISRSLELLRAQIEPGVR